MMKWGPMLVSMLLLAACSILPERAQVGLYAPVMRLPEPAAAGAEPVAWRLALRRPTASGPLRTPRILVRPAPGQVEVYPQAAWIQPPPGLFDVALLEALEADGRMPAVQRIAAGLEHDYELNIDLRAFELELVDGPRAVLRLRADLLRQPEGLIVATRQFKAEVPAAGQDVDATVAALGQALEQLLPGLADWLVDAAERDWRASDHRAPDSGD